MSRTLLAMFLAGLLASCAESSTTGDGADDGPVVELPDTADAPAEDVPAETGCPAGQTDCGGLCVDTSTDHDHCGGCATPCEPAEVCANGVCLFECPTGTVACGGSCTDVMTDIQSCGACDTACTAGLHAEPVCELGLCGVRCEAGWTDPDGDGSCDAGCAPTSPTETCNGVDDNCDGRVDESFPCRMGREVGCATVCGSTGSGVCGLDCQVPAAAACTPPAEVCNGQDDDCTGGCDNGLGCCRGDEEPCDSSCGTQGSRLCSALCEWSACIPPDETCNGVDDDCDGGCDDGFGCCRGQSQSCGTGCGTTGTQTCSGGCTWGACEPPAETCNGADDDCDGTCDDGFGCCQGATGTCTTSCGTTGTRSCGSSCSWSSCAPPGETCNGTDDNCDGTADNTSGCRIPVYRYLCSNDHFYYNGSSTPSGCVSEGLAWYNYATAVSGTSFSTTPLYRLYSGSVNDHFYTISASERDYAVSIGYIWEGDIGNCSPSPVSGLTTDLYRLVHPAGDHFYTIDASERDYAVSIGYIYEGIACYVWTSP